MNEQRHVRILPGIVVALVVLNIGLLTWIWVRPATPPPERTRSRSGTFLADTLRFTPRQRQQLAALQKTYFQQLRIRQKPLKQARKAYFRLADSSFTAAQRRERSLAFHQQSAEMDLLTLAHFDRVADLCTPWQRNQLNTLLSELPSRAFRMPRTRRSGQGTTAPPKATTDSVR